MRTWPKFKTFFTLLFSLSLLFALPSAYADELLEVDDAFQLQTPTVENGKITIKWKIAKDYKLYKDKMDVISDNATLQAIEYSKAKTVDDPLFGRVEAFYGAAELKVPYSSSSNRANLTISYQGCADKIGVCYPPQTRNFTVDLPAQAKQSSSKSSNSLAALNAFLVDSNGEPELLEADDAFQFSAEIVNGQVVATWNIAQDYHLYQDKIKVNVLDGSATLAELELPKATEIDDPLFGRTMVYHDQFQATLPITNISSNATIEFEFQGCSALAGVCYPPMQKTFQVNAADINMASTTGLATTSVNTAELSESDQITATLQNSSVWIVIITFFVFGLLLSFTPCVFPMIPILSSIIVGQGDKLTTRRAFTMSLVYVLAMSITYTAAGVLAGIFGENLQAAFQNPWIIGTFSAIFIALAFSMFGFYELQLPGKLQTKITNLSNKQDRKSVV